MTGTVGSMAEYIPGRFIEDLTWPEVAEALGADLPVIVPIGAASKSTAITCR